MYKKDLEEQVHALVKELALKTDAIIASSRSNADATDRIMRLVSSTVSAEVEGYMIDLYVGLVEKIKSEDFFKDPEHMNAFYRLNLREDIKEKYQFNINSIDSYKKGIQYTEINSIYASFGAVAGTLAVGGILKYALSGSINIPFVIVIAGALAAACVTFFAIPRRNKREFKRAVDKFFTDLENGLLEWFVDVECYFDKKARTLY